MKKNKKFDRIFKRMLQERQELNLKYIPPKYCFISSDVMAVINKWFFKCALEAYCVENVNISMLLGLEIIEIKGGKDFIKVA